MLMILTVCHTQAGAYIRDDIVSDIIQFISLTSEYQPIAVQHLYTAVSNDIATVSHASLGDNPLIGLFVVVTASISSGGGVEYRRIR